MAYGIDQFIFVTTDQKMYYNTTGTPMFLQDQYLVQASDGLLTYFIQFPVNTVEDIRDCYDAGWQNGTTPFGTGNPYNG